MSATSIFRLVFGLLIIALIAAAALLSLLPGLKEGFDKSELPRIAAISLALLAAGWGWFRLSRGAGRWVGLAVLAVPLLANLEAGGRLLYNEWSGRRLAAAVRITSVRATMIEWPGFDGPVGVRLEIGIERPEGLEGNLFPPKIGVHPPRDYFSDYGALLVEPVFPLRRRPYTFPASESYDLHSSSVRMLESPQRLCIDPSPHSRTAGDGKLSASWLFARAGGAMSDLSPQMTAALPGHLTAEVVNQMIRRFEPGALSTAGYTLCPAPTDSVLQGSCYCRKSP